MNLKKYLIISTVVLLNACSLMKPQQPSDWHAQRHWQSFEASGRLGVKIDEKGSYANFDWVIQNGVETIDVNTPLGNTVGQLCRDAEGVLAVDDKGKVFEAETPMALSEKLLGYNLPLEHLSVWANGEWVDNIEYTIKDGGVLLQSGWRIHRQLNVDGSPHILLLENDKLTLRMVFTESKRQAGTMTTHGRCAARKIL